MNLELYGVNEDEDDVRETIYNLTAVRVLGDTIEVVTTDGKVETVAYGYSDNHSMFWRTEPAFIDGKFNPNYENLPEFSGLNIIS